MIVSGLAHGRQDVPHGPVEVGVEGVVEGGGVAEAGDDEVARGDDHDDLAPGTSGVEGVEGGVGRATAGAEPELAAVVAFGVGGGRGADEVDPALGQDALAGRSPDTVPEVEQAEAGPVARGAIVEAGHDEVAPGVWLQ